MKKFTLIVVVCLLQFVAVSQECTSIAVKGSVRDTAAPQTFYNTMIVNRSTSAGGFGSPNGTFDFIAKKGDTVVISVTGYRTTSFIVDSYNCKQFKTIILQPITYQSNVVVVNRVKTLDEIKKERQELALRETHMVKGIDVMQSPITALYERFSKMGKSKTLAAKLEHQDDMNNVVKDLLRLYVSYDVVELDESEFIDFVQFLNIPEQLLKTASDYELIVYIKSKLEEYKKLNDYYYQKKE